MKAILYLCCLLGFASFSVNAQEVFSNFSTSSFTIGASAISIDSITAKTLQVRLPIYDAVSDTNYNQIIFSCRQPGDGSQTYLNKAGFASLSYNGDTLNWKNETGLFDLEIAGQHLMASADRRSLDFDLHFGFDRERFDKRITYLSQDGNYALVYLNDRDETLSVMDVNVGTVIYTVTIPRQENWSDVKAINDSLIVIAASGIHCLHLRNGLQWSYVLKTGLVASGPMVYSPAIPSSLHKTGSARFTATSDELVTQLSSNILIDGEKIYFANSQKMMCINANGKLEWQTDLSDYEPAKMVLEKSEKGIVLVNFGLGVHIQNFVILNDPFVLLIKEKDGEIIDQYGLSEVGSLVDFMQTNRGFSFGGKSSIVEIQKEGSEGLYKKIVPIDNQRYGVFLSFIDGDLYHTFREGYHVPLNFIDDQLVYFRADNNKIYGISGDRLMYEYHFTELHRQILRFGDKNLLEGLHETIITSRNFELLATIYLADRKILLRDKLYFFDDDKIHVIDLNFLK